MLTWGDWPTHVNVVDADSLEDLGLDGVADTALGHDGDGDGVDDLLDHGGVGLDESVRCTRPCQMSRGKQRDGAKNEGQRSSCWARPKSLAVKDRSSVGMGAASSNRDVDRL